MTPRTIWLTGLPASGKSTLAQALIQALRGRGLEAVLLDGDDLRASAHTDLGFSRQDRAEQVRRTACLARDALSGGRWAVVALVSPYRQDRREAFVLAHPVIEVHVATTLAVCRQRDPKGLYARAAQGRLVGLTGVDAPYEPPESPAVRYDAGVMGVADGVALVFELLARTAEPVRTSEESDLGRQASGD